MKRILAAFLLFMIIFQSGCSSSVTVVPGKSFYEEKGVTIADKGSYFNITLDFNSGLTHKQMGQAFARGILEIVPDYEALIDSYIAENITKYEYAGAIWRTDDIRLHLNQDYKDELEGMADVFSGGESNVRGDNKISRDECYMFNLFADVVRGSQCSFLSVYGSRSETHKNITGRNLDWYCGSKNQLPKIQAVTTIKNPKGSICSIGYMGFLGIISGFNQNKVFAAILDSQTNSPYSSVGKRSYPLDLRFALENKSTLDEAAEFMKAPENNYAINFLIAFSDPDTSKILESNFSGSSNVGQRVRRALRTNDSKLNDGITWGISDSVGCVNSFILYGNYDNHTQNKYNTRRWKSMKDMLLSKGPEVTADEIKDIMTYTKNGSLSAFFDTTYLYNRATVQTILFQPDSLSLEVAFHPKNTTKTPAKPVFEKIPVFQ